MSTQVVVQLGSIDFVPAVVVPAMIVTRSNVDDVRGMTALISVALAVAVEPAAHSLAPKTLVESPGKAPVAAHVVAEDTPAPV